jgi:PAS domain S-box-containing protein
MTPTSFVASGIIIAIGLFRFNILKVVPIARNVVVENMDDGVIVLDNKSRILDINRAAEKIIGQSSSGLIGKPADLILTRLPDWQRHLNGKGRMHTEIIIESPGNKCIYEVRIISIYDRKRNLTGQVMALHDITERKKMEQSLKEYAQRITQVQEEERKRIAYELHDDTAQYLSILKLQLDSLIHSGKIQDPEVIKKLGYLEKDAGRAVDDVRRYSHELRPGVLDHLGLRAALEQLAEDIDKLKQVRVVLEVEGDEPELTDNIKLGLFRIAQEALSNARKHSKAKDVFINLYFTDNLVKLTVTDNGVGFDVGGAATRSSLKGSLGLMSMQERAALIGADLKIESKPGYGTKITSEVKL